MEFSQKGTALLKELEGFKPYPYLDIGGYWTIGYGTRIGKNSDGQFTITSVTEDSATKLLLDHVHPTATFINHVIAVPLTQNQFDALVVFVYNIGEGEFIHSTMLQMLNNKQYTDAANQFDRWVYEHGVVSNGLKNRRAKEKALFLGV